MAQPNHSQSPHKKSNNRRRRKKNKRSQAPQQPQLRGHHDSTHANNNKVLRIDGSMMEGGGQILRNSMTLSALLDQAIHIRNIRGKRSTPGLRMQHSKGIGLVHTIKGGSLRGNAVKSMDVHFDPCADQSPSFERHFTVDIETAGSVCLLIQTCLPLLVLDPLRSPSSLTCLGGTNASFAPQVCYP